MDFTGGEGDGAENRPLLTTPWACLRFFLLLWELAS